MKVHVRSGGVRTQGNAQVQGAERQIENLDLIEMKINDDLKLNGNGLSVHFSGVALPLL